MTLVFLIKSLLTVYGWSFQKSFEQMSLWLPFAEGHLSPGLKTASRFLLFFLNIVHCTAVHLVDTLYNIKYALFAYTFELKALTFLRTPGMSAIQTVGHTIFVDRRSDQSRRSALENIVSRAVSPLNWPKVSTTDNHRFHCLNIRCLYSRKALQPMVRLLLGFKLVDFRSHSKLRRGLNTFEICLQAGRPVQPVTVRYSHPHLTIWTRDMVWVVS